MLLVKKLHKNMTNSADCQLKTNSGVSTQLVELAKAAFEPVKAENYRRTKEAWQAVDAVREADGRDAYNAKRRNDRKLAAAKEGRSVRPYREPDSEAKKAKRTADNTLRMWNKRHPAAEVPAIEADLSDDDVAWLADHP